MNKAEEFYKRNQNILAPFDDEYTVMIKMMEAYLQSRVNAISDEMIEDEFKGDLESPYLLENLHKRDNYFKEFGAKWFKEQLLKQ